MSNESDKDDDTDTNSPSYHSLYIYNIIFNNINPIAHIATNLNPTILYPTNHLTNTLFIIY